MVWIVLQLMLKLCSIAVLIFYWILILPNWMEIFVEKLNKRRSVSQILKIFESLEIEWAWSFFLHIVDCEVNIERVFFWIFIIFYNKMTQHRSIWKREFIAKMMKYGPQSNYFYNDSVSSTQMTLHLRVGLGTSKQLLHHFHVVCGGDEIRTHESSLLSHYIEHSLFNSCGRPKNKKTTTVRITNLDKPKFVMVV